MTLEELKDHLLALDEPFYLEFTGSYKNQLTYAAWVDGNAITVCITDYRWGFERFFNPKDLAHVDEVSICWTPMPNAGSTDKVEWLSWEN